MNMISICFLVVLLTSCQQSSGTGSGSGDMGVSGSGGGLFDGTTEPTTTETPFTEDGPIDGVDYLSFLDILESDNGLYGELRRTLDGCSNPIYINEGFPYGTGTETQMRVCSNGVISIGSTYFYYWYPSLFPTRYIGIRSSNVVAVFWNDHDHRSSGSRIVYKTYKPDQGATAKTKLDRVSRFVSEQIEEEFSGVWMMVAHWMDVPPYPFGSYYYQYYYGRVDPSRNSYQGIIITDGVKTFTVFNYNCEMIEWSGSYRRSVIGYNINTKSARGIDFPFYRNHPLSGSKEVSMVACANMDSLGVSWSNIVYQIGVATDRTQVARAECLKRAVEDGSTFLESTASDSPCPCSFWQAIFDNRYSYASYRLALITGDFSFFNTYCFVQRFRPRSNRGVQMCCYSIDFKNFGALLDSSYGYFSSSLLRYHPFWDSNNYKETDYLFRESCCYDGDICTEYTRLRPADNCASYRAPRRAWCWGDPHITNLDGGVYTFNGWGEYTLLDINTPDTTFVLQGRTHPVTNSTATQLVALAFGLSKYSSVEVRLPNEYDADTTETLLVFFKGESILANISSSNDTFEHENVTITRGSPTSIVTSFPNGIGMIVNASAMLGFTLIVPEEYRGMGSGLSGNYNGDPMDDVVFKNGSMLTPPVSDPVIHEVGQSWTILPEESLFTYPDGLTAEDFQHRDHSPVFITDVLENPPPDVLAACGDTSRDCIFDAIQTGNIEMGLQSQASNQLNIDEQEQAANYPPVTRGPQVLFINLNETAYFQFNVTDDQNISLVNVFAVDGLPAGSNLTSTLRDGYTDFTFEWIIEEVVSQTLRFVAEDELEARSVLNVQVQICACLYGNCTMDGVRSNASTVLLNCECPEGREGAFCEEDTDGCEQITCFPEGTKCMDVPAPGVGAVCGPCPKGYFADGEKCADIDECLNGTHNCAQTCVNTEGGFECGCNSGYQILSETHCEDINECSKLNGGCHHMCMNLDGGFLCTCDDGYQLLADNSTCEVEPGAMCAGTNSCEDLCALVSGTEVCGCAPGYMLNEDGRSCQNINECDQSPCGENGACEDGDGSFTCTCNDGFQLIGDTLCQDINECLEAALAGNDLCDSDTTLRFCVNTIGDYMCQCPDGVEQRIDLCFDPELQPVLPSGIEEYVVVITIHDHSLFTFSVALEAMFRRVTAQAVNEFCGTNQARCVFSSDDGDRVRRQTVRLISEDNVKTTDLADNHNSQVTFNTYVESENEFLSGTALLEAINSIRNDYGFSVSAVLLVRPTIPPSRVPTLTTEQIVGIAVGVSGGVLLVAVLVLVICSCLMINSSKKKVKVLAQDEELKKSSKMTNKIAPEIELDVTQL